MVLSLNADELQEEDEAKVFQSGLKDISEETFKQAREEVRQMILLFELSRRFSLGLTKEDSESILWTGFDHAGACKLSDPIREYFFPSSKKSKDDQNTDDLSLEERVKQLSDFIEELVTKGSKDE